MTLYIIKDGHNQEISTYTDFQRAKFMSEQLNILAYQIYRIEVLTVESENELAQIS